MSAKDGCAPESPDGAINHVFRCGLTLAAIVCRPDVTDEVAHRLGEVIDELDLAVSGIRRAAFTAFVADHDPPADTSEPDPTTVVAPFARRVADAFYDLETHVPLYYDDNHTRPSPVEPAADRPRRAHVSPSPRRPASDLP